MTPTSPYTPANLLAIETLLQFKQVDCEFSPTDIRAAPANRLTSRRGIKLWNCTIPLRLTSRRGIKLWNCTIPLRFVTSRKVLSDLRHKLVTELGRKVLKPNGAALETTCEAYEESTTIYVPLLFSYEYRWKKIKCRTWQESS
ncbi:unnamed protein product [Arctogadus glacialis]